MIWLLIVAPVLGVCVGVVLGVCWLAWRIMRDFG